MRKNVFGRQFKRDTNERKALFKGLLSALVLNERIKTTEQKAKAIKADADKLITKAKKGGLHAYKLVEPELTHAAVKKLLNDIAPRFTNRQGGYTRIIRTNKRIADNATMVFMEWTEKPTQIAVIEPSKDKTTIKTQKTEKKEDLKAEAATEKKKTTKEKTSSPRKTTKKAEKKKEKK